MARAWYRTWSDGTVDEDPPVYTWVVDLTPPVTTITSGPATWNEVNLERSSR